MDLRVKLRLDSSQEESKGEEDAKGAFSHEAGVTLYMCEDEHYEIAVRKFGFMRFAVLRLNIGGIKHVAKEVLLPGKEAWLKVEADHNEYRFFVTGSAAPEGFMLLGSARTKYLSSEVSSGFTGTMVGLYATGDVKGKFSEFELKYES